MGWESERERCITNSFISTTWKTHREEQPNERGVRRNGMGPANTIIPSKQWKRENCSGEENTKKHRWHLLGEVAQFCLNAAVSHAHPCQCWADVPGGTLDMKSKQIVTYNIRAGHSSWSRKIWFSKKRHNTSEEDFEKPNSLLSDGFTRSFFSLLERHFQLQPLEGQVLIVTAEPINVTFVWGTKQKLN